MASSGKLNLSLRFALPNGQASFLTSTRKSQKTHFKADFSCISLANNKLMDVTQLALTWVGWPNGEKLASTSVSANLISTKVSASHRKSTQAHARPGQTESQVDPGFQLAFTCDSVWPGLKKENTENCLRSIYFAKTDPYIHQICCCRTQWSSQWVPFHHSCREMWKQPSRQSWHASSAQIHCGMHRGPLGLNKK